MSCCCVLPSLNFSNSGLTVVVSGIVRNTSGNTVSGAVVYLSSSPPTNDRVPQNIISKTTSNSSGAYVFNNLNPGNYYVGFAVYGSPYSPVICFHFKKLNGGPGLFAFGSNCEPP